MKKSPWPHWDTHTHTFTLEIWNTHSSLWTVSFHSKRRFSSVLPVRTSLFFSYLLLDASPGEAKGERKVLTWPLLSRLALGSLGCVCGFLQDCPLELSICISQDSGSTSPAGCCHLQAASDFHSISLWGPHPQAEAVLGRTCFKETQAGIPGAQSSHSFNLPLPRWGKGKSSHFPQHSCLLCHFRPLWLPSHICFLRQVSHANPQILGDTYQALQLLPLKPIYQGLRWKANPLPPHPPWGG